MILICFGLDCVLMDQGEWLHPDQQINSINRYQLECSIFNTGKQISCQLHLIILFVPNILNNFLIFNDYIYMYNNLYLILFFY